jgi:hypothetical protein
MRKTPRGARGRGSQRSVGAETTRGAEAPARVTRPLGFISMARPAGGGKLSPCPAGATCTGTPATTPDCYVNGGGPVVEGRIVLTCGTRSQVNHVNPAIADSDTGSRLTSIDVEIE